MSADYHQHYGKSVSATSRALMFLCLERNTRAVHFNVTSEPRAISPAPYSQSERSGACRGLGSSNHREPIQAMLRHVYPCVYAAIVREHSENVLRTNGTAKRRQLRPDRIPSVLWRVLRTSVSGIL